MVVRPERIILFGSAAAGKATRDSDIDLLIVTEDPSRSSAVYRKLYDALRGLRFPFDVFLIAPQRFEETKNLFGGIAYPAHKYGRVIYERA